MFLIRPLPKSDEHLLAFLTRVSWLNHLGTLQDLLFACELNNLNNRIPYLKLVTGNFNLSNVAKFLAFDDAILEHSVVTVSQKKLNLLGKVVPTDMVDFSHPRICLSCFKNQRYIPSYTSVLPFTCCPIHMTRLLDYWDTDTKVCWGDKNFWSKIIDLTPLSITATSAEVALCKFLTSLWRGEQRTSLPKPLHLLSLFDGLLLLRFIAKYRNAQVTRLRPTRESAQSWGEAFKYLCNWPKSIYGLFAQYERMPFSKKKRAGLRATFRDLYDELYIGPDKSSFAYACLRNEFEKFLTRPESKTKLWSPNHKLISAEHIQYISFKNAMQILGVRKDGLLRYINLNLLKTVNSTNSTINLLSKKEVLELAKLQGRLINFGQLCEVMRISKTVAIQIINAGHISFLAQPTTKQRDWLFDIAEIEQLIAQLINKSTSAKALKHGNIVAAWKSNHFQGKNFAKIIEEMLSGELEFAYSKDKSASLSLYQFQPRPANDLGFTPKGFITPREASDILRVNINVIYDLIKREFIIAKKVKVTTNPRPISLISTDSILWFQNNFILKPKNRGSLTCISGPKLDGASINIYRRNDV